MAHNIQAQLAALNERNSRLEALFAALHEGVVVIDLDGHVRVANPAAGKLFPALSGIKSQTSPLTLMEATMLPALQDAVDELRARLKAYTAPISGEVEPADPLLALTLKTETGAHLEAALTLFGDKFDGGILAVFRDISEKERLERLRRDFVANVSHELKTPLTSIKGYTEALLDMERNAKNGAADESPRRSFLQTIAKNAEHMNKIVQGLLHLARAEHHSETASLEEVDLAQIMREAVYNKMLLAKERDLSLRLAEGAMGDPVRVKGLGEALSEVFHNLLDNALKYADAGTIIDVGLERTAAEVIASVKNIGPVIPADRQERIFERFYRLDRDGNVHKSGSAGLGLAICKRTIMGFGGRIWVNSPAEHNPEQGAIFYVALRAGGEERKG